jgi:GNAT superfamily N-acetyltransferase
VAVEVIPVRSLRERRAFVDLPFRLHANQPVWIPPLRIEQHAYLSPRLNPFFKDGEAQLMLARRDGRVAGRISAHVDHASNRYHGRRWGSFGFLDVEDDPEVLGALLGEAERWLRERGCDRMVGPMDFTMNDGAGVLIEGFEREPFVRQTWHPPYVARRCEEVGLAKAMDLLMWELHISDRAEVLPVVWELAERCRTEHGIRIRRMSRRRLRADLDLFGELYNEAWKDNWDFRPYSKADLDAYAQELQLVFDPNWFMVAETASGEPAGIAITVPDVNQVLKRMKGRLLPFGWWHFLRKGRIVDRVRVGFLGVKPEFQHAGVAALLYTEHFETAEHRPQKWGEMGWILETNEAMNRGMEAMNGRVVKRYRMFERLFDGSGDGGGDGG